MKRLVDGVEVEFDETADVELAAVGDRTMVRTPAGTHSAVSLRVGDTAYVSYMGRQFEVEKPSRTRSARLHSTGEIHAPMPGLVVEVYVSEGDSVAKGAKLLVLEAMKTQQVYTAPFDGRIDKLSAEPGQQVVEGALLALVVEGPGL